MASQAAVLRAFTVLTTQMTPEAVGHEHRPRLRLARRPKNGTRAPWGVRRGVQAAFVLSAEAERDVQDWRRVLEQPNVNGIGVGYRIRGGRPTKELSLLVFVERKRPLRRLSAEELVPPALPPTLTGGEAVRVDVYELGKLRPQPAVTRSPVKPGFSIGHARLDGAGTLGAIVAMGRQVFLLSNSHVLAPAGQAKRGDRVIYPGKLDGGRNPTDVVAELAEFTRLVPSRGARVRYVNAMDAAIAEVIPTRRGDIETQPQGIGRIGDVSDPKIGMRITKSGRTTGVTRGRVIAYPAQVEIRYEGIGVVGFSKTQAVCTRYSRAGDSGALILEQRTRKAVGLHFGGGEAGSVFTPIREVLREFAVRLVK